MRTYTLVFLFCFFLTGCATHQGSDGSTYYWIAPLPSGDGTGFAGRSAGVTTYQGTVNGRSYTVTSFR